MHRYAREINISLFHSFLLIALLGIKNATAFLRPKLQYYKSRCPSICILYLYYFIFIHSICHIVVLCGFFVCLFVCLFVCWGLFYLFIYYYYYFNCTVSIYICIILFPGPLFYFRLPPLSLTLCVFVYLPTYPIYLPTYLHYPVCGMMHIIESLLLIGKSCPCGGSGFLHSLS